MRAQPFDHHIRPVEGIISQLPALGYVEKHHQFRLVTSFVFTLIEKFVAGEFIMVTYIIVKYMIIHQIEILAWFCLSPPLNDIL